MAPTISPREVDLGSPLRPSVFATHARLLEVTALCITMWLCAWAGLAFFEPAWYTRLSTNKRKRNYAVGLILGLAFKLLTIPSCALAAAMTRPEDDVAGIHPSMNDHQQICWGSRGTTVILELYHYLGHTELIVHHGLILLIMVIIATFNGPHRGFDLSLGALVSEFPSLTFSIIKELGLIGEYPSLEWALLVAGAGLTLAIRVPAIFVCMAMLPASGLRGGPSRVVLGAYSFYLVYNLNISWRRLRRAQVWQSWQTEDGGWDFVIRFNKRFLISSAGFVAGLATLGILVLILAFLSVFDFATTDWLLYAAGISVPTLLWAVQVLQRDERCHRSFSRAVQQLASIELPRLGTISPWCVGLWVLYIVRLVSVGEVPEEHNKHLNPLDVMARSVPFCELILTWSFWICAVIALLLPMAMVRAQSDTPFLGMIKRTCSGAR